MTVYAKIENNKLITASNNLGVTGLADSPELCLANGFVAYDDDLISKYFSGQAEIQNDNLVDISDSDEYKAKVLAEQNAFKKADLTAQINELDSKSIRALREGGVKDETSSQTWLEYYTQQIQDLRTQISALG